MYQSYYRMSCNPFIKELEIRKGYKGTDYKEIKSRLEYLKEIKGIGVITGATGYGKTFAIRSFISELNEELYKKIYISATEKYTLFEFYKIIANELGIDTGACYRNDIYENIQKEIVRLIEEKGIQPIIIIDEAEKLKREILRNLKYLYDFEIDSKDYTIIVLVGNEDLIDELRKNIYESLRQRILVNYKMKGLSREEVKEYVESRFKLAEVGIEVFTEDGINALYACSKSSIRVLNNLILNCLMLGYQLKEMKLDSKIVMDAKGEMELK